MNFSGQSSLLYFHIELINKDVSFSFIFKNIVYIVLKVIKFFVNSFEISIFEGFEIIFSLLFKNFILI